MEHWWMRTPHSSNNVWFASYGFEGAEPANYGTDVVVRPTLYLDPLLYMDGSVAGFPAPDLIEHPIDATPVTTGTTTTVTAGPNTGGNILAAKVATGRITAPSFGDTAPTGAEVTKPFASGSGLSAASGNYIGIYELDSSQKVVAFSQIRINMGATGVSLNQGVTIKVGGYKQLSATPIPATAAVQVTGWSSSDPGAATVSSTGLVKGVAAGSVTITVSTADNLTATSTVTVEPATTIPTTVDEYSSNVAVTNTPVLVNVPNGVNASLDTTPTVSGENATVIMPQVTSTAATSQGNINLSIPNQTQITGPATWDGTINLPQVVNNPYAPYGSKAIKIGAGEGATLILSQLVRILLVGQAQNIHYGVGWIKNGVFTYIPYIGNNSALDNPAAAVRAPGDRYLNLGSERVIWTKHFTTFVTNVPLSSGGDDGGGGGGG